MGFIPTTVGSNNIGRWRSAGSRNQCPRLGLGMATFYNAMAQEKLLSRELMELCRRSQGGFDTDVVLGPRVADHGWGLGYMLNQCRVAGPNPRIFGHGGSGGSTRSSIWKIASAMPADEPLRRDEIQRRPAQRHALE